MIQEIKIGFINLFQGFCIILWAWCAMVTCFGGIALFGTLKGIMIFGLHALVMVIPIAFMRVFEKLGQRLEKYKTKGIV